MAFATQVDLDFVRQMVDVLNVQQQQNVTTLGALRGEIGQAITISNQTKQDFEDATKLKQAQIEERVKELTKQAQEECTTIHNKVTVLHQQCVNESGRAETKLAELANTEKSIVDRLQSLATTEQNVSTIQNNLEVLYKKMRSLRGGFTSKGGGARDRRFRRRRCRRNNKGGSEGENVYPHKEPNPQSNG